MTIFRMVAITRTLEILCVRTRCVFWNSGDRWRHNAQKLVDETRVSCGGGVVLKLGGIARVELNYCVPIRSQPCDR